MAALGDARACATMVAALVGVWGLLLGACAEETITGVEREVRARPVTVELEIPWSEFASNLEVFGGYGTPLQLGVGVIARNYAGTLNAHTLTRVGGYPSVATVRDTTGTNRTDSVLTFTSGRFVAVFDTIASTNTVPVTVGVGALQSEWDPATVTWTSAVDTINDLRAWPEPGAGPVTDFGDAVWDPATSDSIWVFLDSAEVALLGDTANALFGARLDLRTDGERVHVLRTSLYLDVRPSVNPDTVITLGIGTTFTTFIYDPVPQPPPDGVRIGGAPSWRTLLDVTVPSTITGPAGFCAAVTCPHTVSPSEISYAALVLTSRASEAAYQPTDSIALDVRPVLQRAAMPKSPLGESLIPELLGRVVPASAFGAAPGQRVEIPITGFARALLAGDDGTGVAPPNTLALLSVFEPYSIAFASFHGPGTPDEPRLRLVLTIGPRVQLP